MHTPQPSVGSKRVTKLVGSRGSGLSLRQTEEVLDRLRHLHPEADFRVVSIKTGGDIAPEAPLASLGPGIFVKEIERALLNGEVDLAVHSLKDLPTRPPEGVTIGAVCKRLDPRDVLVDRWDCPLDELPPGARIGTSSPRREAQLRSLRPDLKVLPIRGNVDTRVRKARGEEYDGAILAAAGILRLGMEASVAQFLSPEDFVPAPGQGALAVETRLDDQDTLALLSAIDHSPTRRDVMAERAFLELLGSGCGLPAGAYARADGDTMVMTAFLSSLDGSKMFKAKVRGRASNPHEVALDAYQRLIERGARDLVKGIRGLDQEDPSALGG